MPKKVGRKSKGGKKGGSKGKKSSVKMAKASVPCMAFNKDFTSIAFGVGKEIWIYDNGGAKEPLSKLERKLWVKKHVLKAHDLEVSGIDWDAGSNKIVSCSHDRNAFVWTQQKDGEWKQGLVILRITRAALACKWSPKGNKFAVTSGAKRVPICRFEEADDWWIPEMISKHKSSVVSVDWHPNNQLIATGSTDFKCRVISAYLKKVDGEQVLAPFESEGEGNLGEVLAEFECKGWVVDVQFSPSGDKLCYIGMDSTVTVVDCESLDSRTSKTGILPFSAVMFIDETNLIAAGFNFMPYKITDGADGVDLGESIDKGKVKKKAKAKTAMSKFQDQDSFGDKGATESLSSKHQAPITCMRRCGKQFCTAGEDGRVVFWDV